MTDPSSDQRGRGLRRWFSLIARVLVLAMIAVWFLWFADLSAFAAAVVSIPLWSLAVGFLLQAGVMALGGIRWRLLMGAFGAEGLPPVLTVIRLFFVGLFYNTFVPGSVGGDVVRGVVTRHYFDKAATSYVVVVIERLLGFSAMGVVFLIGLGFGPDIIELREYLPWLGILLGLGLAVLIVTLASGRLARRFKPVPTLRRPLQLVWVLALSLLAHMSGIAATFVLARGMGLPLDFAALVLIMPMAFTAAFIPLNVLGVGTREVTVVALLGLLGIEAEPAAALSLGYAAIVISQALAGGIIQLIQGRVGAAEPSEADSDE